MSNSKMFRVPTTTKEGNEWLKRVGALHLKFSSNKKRARLENVFYDIIYIEADSVSDICSFFTFQPEQMIRFGIPKYDWFITDDIKDLKNIEILI